MSLEVLTKRAVAIAGIGTLALLAACSTPDSPKADTVNTTASTAPSTTPTTMPSSAPKTPVQMTVTVKNMAFSPASLTVPVGSTITWDFEDSMLHTTTSDKGDAQQWDSGPLGPGNKYPVKFTTAGTYTYHCSLHSSMTGTIIVQ
ncbi:MAG TPA: plastocyanin/azurin family copper-binding protein [Oscillatoriaceae cyanobacterium]